MRRRSADQESAPGAAAAVAPVLARGVARALAAAVTGENRLAFARSLTFNAAAAYAASLRPARIPLPASDGLGLIPLAREAESTAMQLGSGLAGIPAPEAAYLLGCIYTCVLPADFRAAHGVFYTPPEIVRHTLDMAERAGIDWRHARCLDPSAGGGAFVIEMITRIRDALGGTDPALVLSQIATRVRGYDARSVRRMAWRRRLHISPFTTWRRPPGDASPKIVHVRDSLDMHPDDRGTFDLVASNVPFGRITLPPERRAFYARSTYGHANLYGLFTDAGLQYAKLLRGVVATSCRPRCCPASTSSRYVRCCVNEAPPHEPGLCHRALGRTTTHCRKRCWRPTGRADARAPARFIF